MPDPTATEWDDLVGDLYQAAVDPDAAARLPVTLARITGAGTSALWCFDPRTGALEGEMLTNLPAEATTLYADRYHALDPWTPALGRAGLDGIVVRGSSLIEDAALARSAYYGEFGAAFDTFHVMGAVLPLGREAALGVVAVQRPRGRGAFEDAELAHLARLLPHVRRAFQLRAQVAGSVLQAQATALDAMLEAIGTAAVVLDGHGRVRHANTAAERLDAAGTGLRLRAGGPDQGVAAAVPAETHRLRAAIADAARGGPGGALRLQSRSGAALLAVVSFLPRGMAALAGSPQGWALLVLRPLSHPEASRLKQLGAELFGFTPAEAEAAAALCGGLSPSGIAAARQVRVSTVRTLLQRAQDKADAKCLRGLVATLAALRG